MAGNDSKLGSNNTAWLNCRRGSWAEKLAKREFSPLDSLFSAAQNSAAQKISIAIAEQTIERQDKFL
jgi:hypothetical protein